MLSEEAWKAVPHKLQLGLRIEGVEEGAFAADFRETNRKQRIGEARFIEKSDACGLERRVGANRAADNRQIGKGLNEASLDQEDATRREHIGDAPQTPHGIAQVIENAREHYDVEEAKGVGSQIADIALISLCG